MDSQNQRRPVQRNRIASTDSNRASSGERRICLPLTKQQFDDIWDDSAKVRIVIDQMIEHSPELFPQQIACGYQLKGKLPASAKMPDIQLRQIQIAGQRYYLRPSFVIPAFTGTTDELKQPMELLAHGVALWLIVKVFGHDEMFWLRQQQRLGWVSTQNAFTALLPSIVPILCFLHGFLKVRERGRREHELHERIWEIDHSTNIQMFDRRMKAFRKWFESQQWSSSISEMTAKLWKRARQYRQAFKYDDCYRTSNQADRLMNRMTRLMYPGRGLHGNHMASERRLRGWALMVNFMPYAHRAGVEREHCCPAHQLGNKCYSENWLEKLLVSSSINGKP